MPTPARLQPLPPHIVELVRASGWELAPAGWLRRQLDDRDRLRQQLERARAAAVPRDPTPGPEDGPRDSTTVIESHTTRESID